MKTKFNRVFLAAICSFIFSTAIAQNVSTLASFNGGNGSDPVAGLVATNNMLFGTTYSGGASNFGTVFATSIDGGTFSTLYSFQGAIYNTNTSNYSTTDGAYPAGSLVLTDGRLYGTTFSGGGSDAGTVFAINTNGGSYSVIHSFTGNSGGMNPDAGLLLSNSTLFGTTFIGGAGNGSVFRVNIDGSGFTNIHNFTGGSGGANPQSSLVISGNTLYGTTYGPYFGQSSGYGTVFRVNIDGTGFSTVYSFTGKTDGAYPEAGLVIAGNMLYGTTSEDGAYFGTVFKLLTNGTGFVSYPLNGSVGANPAAALVLSGGTLYGTTPNGGTDGWGTVFQLNTDGSEFTNLYNFTDGGDGAMPVAPLVLSGANLYGTTEGSAFADGTVFSMPMPLLGIPLAIISQAGKIVLTWNNPAFTLQSTTNLNLPFTIVFGAESPYTNTPTGSQKFFRLVGN